MSWFKKYFENRRHFVCPECNIPFSLSFWKWLWTPKNDMTRYRYIKCPCCGERNWLQAIKEEKPPQ